MRRHLVLTNILVEQRLGTLADDQVAEKDRLRVDDLVEEMSEVIEQCVHPIIFYVWRKPNFTTG